jgi:hypothetical protein
MQKVGEVVKSFQPSNGSAGTPKNGRDSERVATVFWTRMASLYGHKWASQYGSSPDELWTKALTALGSDAIRRGLEACVVSGDAWPPSLPEFMGMCKPPKRENAAAYRWVPQLPAPVSSKETAQANLAKLRAAIR